MSTPAWAIYDSGSDGSLGDLILKEDPKTVEVTLPTDGVLHYKSISVPAGVTLKFIPNDDNTQVVLLATGDVLIDGVIDVSGSSAFKCDKNPPYKGLDYCAGPGGPGGFSSGMNKQDGNGPGGGTGKTTTGLVSGFKTYGNAEWINLVGGSGSGAPSTNQANSGGGGGAITIASSGAIVVNGQILANGGGNHGGGGKVRLVAETITGNGKVETAGGSNVAIGLIKLESHIITGGLAANSNPAPFLGTPQVSVPYAANQRPSVAITKVDSKAPSGKPGQFPPNLTLTRGKVINVEISTKFIPVNTVLMFRYNPTVGQATVVPTSAVAGTLENGTATVTFTINNNVNLGTLQAWAPAIPIPKATP